MDTGQHFRISSELGNYISYDLFWGKDFILVVRLEDVVSQNVVLCHSGGGAQYRIVLHIADEHVTSATHYTLYRHIERVGGVEGEDDVFGRRAEKVGEGNSCLKDLFGAHHGDRVRAAPSVSAVFAHTFVGGVQYALRLWKGGGGIVEIYYVL